MKEVMAAGARSGEVHFRWDFRKRARELAPIWEAAVSALWTPMRARIRSIFCVELGEGEGEEGYTSGSADMGADKVSFGGSSNGRFEEVGIFREHFLLKLFLGRGFRLCGFLSLLCLGFRVRVRFFLLCRFDGGLGDRPLLRDGDGGCGGGGGTLAFAGLRRR